MRPLKHDGIDPDARRFQTTRWSVVAAAREGADEALAELCRAYWYPLYAFLRRKGWGPDEAEDLVQGFFARLLEKSDLKAVARERGKFRSFLTAACSQYASNRAAHDRAAKRGGGRSPVSIDGDDARARYDREPAHDLTAERLFDRRWALTLLDRAVARLEAEHAEAGRARRFEALRAALLGDGGKVDYPEVARALGTTEDAARTAAHRLRRRYRELVREEVAGTLDRPTEAEIDDEVRDLFAALSP